MNAPSHAPSQVRTPARTPASARADAPPAPAAGDAARSVRRAWIAGALLAAGYLAVAFALLGSYGPTWDCVQGEYPYGERLLEYVLTGDARFRDPQSYVPAPEVRAPHIELDGFGRLPWNVIHPFTGLLSALSCRLLWTETGLVPSLQAHNAVIPLIVGAFLLFGVRFAAPRIGLLEAVSGAFLLVASPIFFAHAFNNLKDPPETCLYVGATLGAYVALSGRRLWPWILAGVLTGLALAVKFNALFIPVQMALVLGASRLLPVARRREVLRLSARGFLLGTCAFLAAYYAVFPRYWSEPIQGPLTFLGGIPRIGNTLAQGKSLEASALSLHAPFFVLITTPPTILALALLGLFSRRPAPELRLLLLAGIAVPLGRNLVPGMRSYDGVRHFLEFLPYLCLLAGLGLGVALRAATRLLGETRAAAGARAALVAAALGWPAYATAATHPNGICYFNSFVGGLGGAQRRGLPEATDYWGNSYWQGLGWLNANAEPGAVVLAPLANHVVRCAAPVRLRGDLRLWDPALELERAPIYVMYITRNGWYGSLLRTLEERSRPVHEIRVQDGVILRVHRLTADEHGAELYRAWLEECAIRDYEDGVRRWMRANRAAAAEIRAHLRAARVVGRSETLARIRDILPAELHGDLESLLEERNLVERAPEPR